MNRINITINSRVYTVVAEEEEGYLKRLCDYVNEKVKLVINEGTHVMGEKPLVLAALNICDEYFKLLDSTNPVQNISEIIAKNKQLEAELRELRKDGGNAAEKIEELRSEAALAEKTSSLPTNFHFHLGNGVDFGIYGDHIENFYIELKK